MSKASSSGRWKSRQAKDPYVRRARIEGYRSRAVYKLIEMNERHRLIERHHVIVDLGAAPGGWSQYAASVVGDSGKVVAVDLLPMEPLSGVDFVQGDFREDDTLRQLKGLTGAAGIDLVMSDMAPNISGVRSADQARAMHLAELALDMARQDLKRGGGLVVKLFHGEGFDEFVRETRQDFSEVKVRKPAASRPKSRETYLVARNYRV